MFQSVEQSLDLAQQSANKEPSTMTDDQIRQVLEAAPLMRQFIEAVESEAQRRMEAGHSVPGFKLVRGRGSRLWGLDDDQIAASLTKMGIPKAALYEQKLISPAKAEKLVWEKKDGTKQQLSPKQLQKLNNEYIIHNQGKLTVAPESDSRSAVTTSVSELFKPVDMLPDWLK